MLGGQCLRWTEKREGLEMPTKFWSQILIVRGKLEDLDVGG